MDSGFKLSTKLSQNLALTPKLQQAIRMLQLNCQELKETVQKELEQNPLLEELKRKPDPDFGNNNWQTRNQNKNTNNNYLEQAIASKVSLQEHLMEQVRLSELTLEQERIALQIVGNLNSQGYLCSTPEEVAETCLSSLGEVQAVISMIQTLDPIGIAAQDLSECLLIQLDHIGFENDLPAIIITRHLDELAKADFKKIAADEQVSIDQVKKAVNVIRRLDPYPGKIFGEDQTNYVIPDVFIRKSGEEYLVMLNNEDVPELKINNDYLKLIASDRIPSTERGFINQNYQAASWLIKSIEQRQKTILDVAKAIVAKQSDFLDHGPAKLKPLILKDIAEELGIHESTVSRVTSNKYADTPQGLIPLKFFFSNALPAANGEISAVSVRDRIKLIIAAEDPKKPISDQDISELLSSENIKVARRTVAKYRESLGIAATSIRKNRD